MKRFNETYKKRRFITRSEWADTYKAIHAETEEKVILKVLTKKSDDKEYINKLSEEILRLKEIKAPNLINIQDMFQYNACGKNYYYIESEYYKGISLEEKLNDSKFVESEAVKIVNEVATALMELHNKKITFPNLNVSNILIDSKGNMKVDLLSYLEQKEFKLEENEPNTFKADEDIYSLGVLLYSLISGNIVFDDKNYKKDIENNNLITIIEKATNKDLEERYYNLSRFILDVDEYLKYRKLSDEKYKSVEEIVTTKDKKSNIGKKVGICATIALALGGAVYGYGLIEKNIDLEVNKTETVNESTDSKKDEEKKVEEEKTEKVEKDKVEKTEEKDVTISKDSNKNESSNKTSANKNSDKNNNLNSNSNSNSSSNKPSNNTTNKPNNSTNKPNNSTNKPDNSTNKPNNNQSSQGTTTNPEQSNDDKEQTSEAIPPSNDSNSSGENDSNISQDSQEGMETE